MGDAGPESRLRPLKEPLAWLLHSSPSGTTETCDTRQAGHSIYSVHG